MALSVSPGTAWNNRSQLWTIPFSSDGWKPNGDKLMLTLTGLAGCEQSHSAWRRPQLLRSLHDNFYLGRKASSPPLPLQYTTLSLWWQSKTNWGWNKINSRSTSAWIVLFCVIFHSRKSKNNKRGAKKTSLKINPPENCHAAAQGSAYTLGLAAIYSQTIKGGTKGSNYNQTSSRKLTLAVLFLLLPLIAVWGTYCFLVALQQNDQLSSPSD